MDKFNPKRIIERIKEQHIAPMPKWKIRLKSYLFWLLLVLLGLFGAFSLSLVLLNFGDFQFMRQIEIFRWVHFLLRSLPIIWILLALMAMVFGIMAFKGTRRGYRHSTLFVASMLVLIVSIISVVIHFSRFNDRFDRAFSDRAPGLHDRFMPPGEKRLFQPQDGILIGKITQVSDGTIQLETPDDKVWTVQYSDQTRIDDEVKLVEGQMVVVVGQQNANQVFEARAIRPFRNRQHSLKKNLPSPSVSRPEWDI